MKDNKAVFPRTLPASGEKDENSKGFWNLLHRQDLAFDRSFLEFIVLSSSSLFKIEI